MSKKTGAPLTKAELIRLYRKAVVSNMSLDSVEDRIQSMMERSKVSEKIETKQATAKIESIKNSLPKIVRWGAFVLPIGFISLGALLLGNAFLPIVQYYKETLPHLTQAQFHAPIPPESVLDVTPLVIAQTAQAAGASTLEEMETGPIILDEKLDYTNLANWFSDATLPGLDSETGTSQTTPEMIYKVHIPKLNIKNAEVHIGGTDLNKGLIQYPGTAHPGRPGAPVIFGHSVLRQFYNPSEKNPRRYVSIFSTIMTLQNGDKIIIEHDGVEYTYMVREKTEVKPEDVHILTQNYNAKQLKLVTCTPEGTYLRRGVVTAELVSS